MKNLICYLTEHHYDQPISLKTLGSPSTKDFQSIFTFLLRRLDPNFQWTGKFEDEVPLILKRLRYPFTVSKSALYAVGSPHTWPTLLGCLTWLVELLIYDVECSAFKSDEMKRIMVAAGVLEQSEKTTNEPVTDTNTDSEYRALAEEQIFFEYVSATYASFLAGSDDYEEFDAELEGAFHSRDVKAELGSHELELQRQNLEKQLQKAQSTLAENEARVSELSQKREDYLSDLEKFRKLLTQLETHKSMLEQKLEERQKETTEKAAETENFRQQLKELSEKTEAQQSLSIDVEHISRRRRELRSALDRAQQKRGDVETRMREATNNKESIQCKVDDVVHRIKLYSERINLSETIFREDTIRSDLEESTTSARAQQIHESVEAAVRERLCRVSEDIKRLNSEALELQESIRAVEEKALIQQEKNRMLAMKLQRLENTYSSERETVAKRLSEASEKNSLLQQEILEMRARVQENIENSQKAIEQARVDWRTLANTTQAEYDAANDSLLLAVERLTDHKVYIQNTLNNLQRRYKAAIAALTEVDRLESNSEKEMREEPEEVSSALVPELHALRIQKKTDVHIVESPAKHESERHFDENIPPNRLLA
jgi:kinetochore protein NDC80